MWRIFPLDIFSAHLSCGEISPRDRFSPPFSCGEIFHLTDLSPHFSCGEISPCDRVSPHLSCGEIFHLTTCHGENFSTWPIFSPQTPSVVSVTNIRYADLFSWNKYVNLFSVMVIYAILSRGNLCHKFTLFWREAFFVGNLRTFECKIFRPQNVLV